MCRSDLFNQSGRNYRRGQRGLVFLPARRRRGPLFGQERPNLIAVQHPELSRMWIPRRDCAPIRIGIISNDEIGCNLSSELDRKSTRLNSSHVAISYAVFCLKKKTKCDLLPPSKSLQDGYGCHLKTGAWR